MDFLLTNQQQAPLFYQEETAYEGVLKVAEKVNEDLKRIFGEKRTYTTNQEALTDHAIIFGTVGNSPLLEQLHDNGTVDLTEITNKREVFLFQVVDHPFAEGKKAIIIAGSDKLGTIFGLFHLSECLGVSPFVDWSLVLPEKRERFELSASYKHVSKEPSVKHRGFFINDEWPAFGNFAEERFGGFNDDLYDHVFELLLRLKGNYMWPAMWSARFYVDAPDLANAKLADSYGITMGASHHEPALRNGDEYKYVRGEDSPYGDAWNFLSNREGIIRFWRDALKERGAFNSMITVGMRGEADTKIMGEDATLKDNIDLLRDVIQTQNRLIKEEVNEDLSQVPRMLALYKEVEPFFYGDAETEGLIGSEELDGVTLMLCDDNHGNLRTLPTESMRDHNGGYGMYYHFDYHGGPISYEWINSSYIPKISEQMTQAYDFGVQDLWIVNVGDICTQELPLAYFLNLAYDIDTYREKPNQYTSEWVDQQLGHVFEPKERQTVVNLLDRYTKIAHRRRPEHMNTGVYHPVNEKETDDLLMEIEQHLNAAEALKEKVDPAYYPAYFSLVYYPVVGNLNVQKMWLLATKNEYLAKLNVMEANHLSEEIKTCLIRDRALVEAYHKLADGYFYGMGLSEHIGFVNWNEDEAKNPVLMQAFPANKARILVSIDGTEQKSEGSPWHVNTLSLKDFLSPDCEEATFTLYGLSDKDATFTIETDDNWIEVSNQSGTLGSERSKLQIKVKIDRAKLEESTEGQLMITTPVGRCNILVPVDMERYDYPEGTFIATGDYVAMDAHHFSATSVVEDKSGTTQAFHVLPDYGKTTAAIKAFPNTKHYESHELAPSVTYHYVLKEAGTQTVTLYMQPSNPVTREGNLRCAVQVNQRDKETVNLLPVGYRVDDKDWGAGVLANIRKKEISVEGKKGLNTLTIYPKDPGFVLQKLVVAPVDKPIAESYLGPKETYYVGRENQK